MYIEKDSLDITEEIVQEALYGMHCKAAQLHGILIARCQQAAIN